MYALTPFVWCCLISVSEMNNNDDLYLGRKKSKVLVTSHLCAILIMLLTTIHVLKSQIIEEKLVFNS